LQSGAPKTVTLVLGGARSGKSRYAQELASTLQRVVYVVTARRDEAAMHALCELSNARKGGDPHEASNESGNCVP